MTCNQEDLPTDPEIIDKYLWVLNRIEKERQLTPDEEAISYQAYGNVRQISKGILTTQEEDSILRRLEQWEIIEITRKTRELHLEYAPGVTDYPRAVNILDLEKFKKIKEDLEERRTEERRINKAVVGQLEEMTEKQEEKEALKKEIAEEMRKEQQPTPKIDSPNGKPYTEIKNGKGYFKFYKQGEGIKIGSRDTRHFRLLQCLCEPHFGVQKTIEAIFDAIRLPKDKNDSDLSDWSPQRQTKILTLIEYAKKELQKNKKLQGKLKYRFDDRKRNMWLELED